MKKNVLITGGAGFIGSHLTKKYLDEGYKVIVVDDFSTGDIQNLSNCIHNKQLVICHIDITNFENLKEVFNLYEPTIVNHHAAQKSVPDSVKDPIFDAKINIMGLLNVLNCCEMFNVKKFIFASSGGALSMEIQDNQKFSEEDKPQLLSPYALTKFAGESYIKIYAQKTGMNYSVLRYANVYGVGQKASGECGVVPIFFENILEGKNSVLMTYDDMPNGCTRDYVSVSDVVNANIIVSEKDINGTYNIGSGKEVTMLELYKLISHVCGRQIPIIKAGPREGDIKRSVLDCNKAFTELGWKPQTNIIDGLNTIRKSYENND